MSKIFTVFTFLFFALFLVSPIFANDTDVTIYFIEQRGCPDCARQKDFFDEVLPDYPDVELKTYYITEQEGVDKLHELAEEHGVEDYRLMVPTTFIDGHFFQGFSESDKDLMIAAIEGEDVERVEGLVELPFFGEVNVQDWSLPILAFVIGSLDGLNVCSIGALALILMIVLTLDSRKKIFFYGGLFIFTAVFIYGLLVFAWTAVIDAIVGHLDILSYFIGAAALLGGIFFFREFIKFLKHGPTCSSAGSSLVANATKRVQNAFQDRTKGTIFLASSVILFAAVMTLVELPCSVALPVVFAGILTESGLPLFGYVSYILLYLFAYMFIEIIIFVGAVITKEVWFAQSRFITWVYLFGSLVLFFLAFYYLIWLNLS